MDFFTPFPNPTETEDVTKLTLAQQFVDEELHSKTLTSPPSCRILCFIFFLFWFRCKRQTGAGRNRCSTVTGWNGKYISMKPEFRARSRMWAICIRPCLFPFLSRISFRYPPPPPLWLWASRMTSDKRVQSSNKTQPHKPQEAEQGPRDTRYHDTSRAPEPQAYSIMQNKRT
jgi:hypothetical protein